MDVNIVLANADDNQITWLDVVSKYKFRKQNWQVYIKCTTDAHASL